MYNIQFNIYLIGYALSIIVLIVSIFILQHFRSLRCVRNHIHTHFMCSILVRGITWITSVVVAVVQPQIDILDNVMVTLRTFILCAVYSWMLVEGIYLLSILYWTLTVQNCKFVTFCAIGWGLPTVLATAFIGMKLLLQPSLKWEDANMLDPEGQVVLGSIFAMLAVNVLVTVLTMYTLMTNTHRRAIRNLSNHSAASSSQQHINRPSTAPESPNDCAPQTTPRAQISSPRTTFGQGYKIKKLSDEHTDSADYKDGEDTNKGIDTTHWLDHRDTTIMEGQINSIRFRRTTLEPWKALKALLVLMPLLGYPQIIFLRSYFGTFDWIFEYISAVLIGTQGFWVSVIYCFANSEVQRVLKFHIAKGRCSGSLSEKLRRADRLHRHTKIGGPNNSVIIELSRIRPSRLI
ncbi:unnamed protein product [Dicrocoelium dendriticum]|nr:unnamed protein product [Dicrocoelium dendriticum]